MLIHRLLQKAFLGDNRRDTKHTHKRNIINQHELQLKNE